MSIEITREDAEIIVGDASTLTEFREGLKSQRAKIRKEARETDDEDLKKGYEVVAETLSHPRVQRRLYDACVAVLEDS